MSILSILLIIDLITRIRKDFINLKQTKGIDILNTDSIDSNKTIEVITLIIHTTELIVVSYLAYHTFIHSLTIN